MNPLYLLTVQNSDCEFAAGVFESFEKALDAARTRDDRLPTYEQVCAEFITEGPEARWSWDDDGKCDHNYAIEYVEVGDLVWS